MPFLHILFCILSVGLLPVPNRAFQKKIGHIEKVPDFSTITGDIYRERYVVHLMGGTKMIISIFCIEVVWQTLPNQCTGCRLFTVRMSPGTNTQEHCPASGLPERCIGAGGARAFEISTESSGMNL